jgi:hypothetical protein
MNKFLIQKCLFNLEKRRIADTVANCPAQHPSSILFVALSCLYNWVAANIAFLRGHFLSGAK